MWHAVGERVLVEALACLHIHLANQDLNELSKENKNTVLIPNIKCYMCDGRSLSVSEIWRQVGERVSEEVSHRDAKHLRVKYFLVVNTVSSMSELLPSFSPSILDFWIFCTFSFCTFLFCTFSFCTFLFCTFSFCTSYSVFLLTQTKLVRLLPLLCGLSSGTECPKFLALSYYISWNGTALFEQRFRNTFSF